MKVLFKKSKWVMLIILLLTSCTTYKKIPYLDDVEALSSKELTDAAMKYEATIMPNDIITITVNTPTSSASKDFNLPLLPTGANDIIQTQVTYASQSTGGLQNYIVDKNGNINFPVLGTVQIGGLTKIEAQKKLYGLIYPKYLKEEPIVSIRFLNYRVTILGEVARPGIYSTANEQMTIFDALANAGDMTIYGKRDNVLLIRESAGGVLSYHRIDLQDQNILLNKEIYYLQQNDKIYVSPNKAKGNNASFGTLESLALSGLSLLISVISIITR